MKTKLTILSILMLIIGCSSPVEELILIEKDGLLYQPDSDKPYSGEIFGSYKSGEKVFDGNVENGVLVENYVFYNKDGSIKEPVDAEQLQERNDIFYKINTDEPYSGQFYESYNSGQKRREGTIKFGKLNGTVNEYRENGQKRFETTFKNGQVHGAYQAWDKNGQLYEKGVYKDGEKDSK